MLVPGALSLPPSGAAVAAVAVGCRRLSPVLAGSGALFGKNERFSREGSKTHKKHVHSLFLFSVKLQKTYENMHPSHISVLFWKL